MKFIKYLKIPQFRNVVNEINYSHFIGDKPVITFTGTVKLHGTNSGICYKPSEGYKIQKRNDWAGKGHFGFHEFVKNRENQFIELFNHIYDFYNIDETNQITIYGEFAGNGIQKKVGISELPKSFYIFDVLIYNENTEESKFLDITKLYYKDIIENVYLIYDFETYIVDIDFNDTSSAKDQIIELVKNIDESCPVTKSLGKEGVGEGIVWKAYYNNNLLVFKTKGDSHTQTKTKSVNKNIIIDNITIESVNRFIDFTCTSQRIEQAIFETQSKELKDIPKFLKWLCNDILEEESKLLEEFNIEWKQVHKRLSSRAIVLYKNIILNDEI